MEERCKQSAQDILAKIPDFESVEFYGFNGYRTEKTIAGAYDCLGIDFAVFLKSGEKLTGQAKIGRHDNFELWGRDRKSFVLGRAVDILRNRRDISSKATDLLLVGYEVDDTGLINPYALIHNWSLLRRIDESLYRQHSDIEGRRLSLFQDHNNRDGNLFVWITESDLIWSNSIITGWDGYPIAHLAKFY